MKKRNPSSDFVREFTESMPRDYLQQHTHEEVVRHARVAAARRSELVRVEVDSGEHHTGNVYFVADDRAGLLARASSALSTLIHVNVSPTTAAAPAAEETDEAAPAAEAPAAE